MLSPQTFQKYAEYIYSHCGIRLTDRKLSSLNSRVDRRMRTCGYDDATKYLRHIQSSSGRSERQQLIDSITTGETSFYRTSQHFDWFGKEFLPELVAAHRAGQRRPRIRLWSAACSVGAEPLTLAMILATQSFHFENWSVEILGTDLAQSVIAQARSGVFRERLLDNVPSSMRTRCFRSVVNPSGTHQVLDRYRKMVRFERHNLMDPPAGGIVGQIQPFDCVFLRNVLIYFDKQSKQKVLGHVADSLAPGGYMVVGPSEGIFGIDHPLQRLSTFLYQKPIAS